MDAIKQTIIPNSFVTFEFGVQLKRVFVLVFSSFLFPVRLKASSKVTGLVF